MLRFILNFFLFGFLFYLIWVFFPEAFNTFVTLAQEFFAYVKAWVLELFHHVPPAPPIEPTHTP